MESKLSSAAGALGYEATEIKHWLPWFGCASEGMRIIVAELTNWLTNSSPPWDAYRTLMACRLVVLYKLLGVR